MLQKSKHGYMQVSVSFWKLWEERKEAFSPFGAESAFLCDNCASLSSSAISYTCTAGQIQG